MKKRLISVLLAGGIIVSVASSAPAAMETQTVDFGSAANPLIVGAAGFSEELAFQKFDTSLGTLKDVIITLTAMDMVEASVANFGAASSFRNARARATITFAGADGMHAADRLATRPFSGSIGAGTLSNPAYLSGPAARSKAVGRLRVSPADYSSFEWDGSGDETFDYVLSATASGTAAGIGRPGVYFGFEADCFGQVKIDYDYTPAVAVPEPGTTMAGMSAFVYCGFAMIRLLRNRNRRQITRD